MTPNVSQLLVIHALCNMPLHIFPLLGEIYFITSWIWADFVTCFDQQDVAVVTSYDFQALASRSPKPSAFTLFEHCGHVSKPICEDERDHTEKPSSKLLQDPLLWLQTEQNHPWPADPPTANKCRVRWAILAELCPIAKPKNSDKWVTS